MSEEHHQTFLRVLRDAIDRGKQRLINLLYYKEDGVYRFTMRIMPDISGETATMLIYNRERLSTVAIFHETALVH